jgi:hypothetical protein
MSHPGIRPKDVVSVLRDISRNEDANYAKAGMTGVVLEVFKTPQDQEWDHQRQKPHGGTMHAKVKMDLPGRPIKTFRLTSLARES